MIVGSISVYEILRLRLASQTMQDFSQNDTPKTSALHQMFLTSQPVIQEKLSQCVNQWAQTTANCDKQAYEQDDYDDRRQPPFLIVLEKTEKFPRQAGAIAFSLGLELASLIIRFIRHAQYSCGLF